ncbi:MAG: HNH endonuclease [Victivallaceae bacterium]|nr:HNH endonuclease [Victivallaceae bacterium]
MDEFIARCADEAHGRRERAKARELRKTPYFQNLLKAGVCHYCGKKFPVEKLTLDHVVPLARGGKSTRGNLVVSCLECNRSKSILTPVEQLLDELEKNGAL